jgi:hypothetical protein
MNRERAKELVAALRSGKYKQARNVLKAGPFDGEPSYCCLGVACEISGLGMWTENNEYSTSTDVRNSVLPDEVQKYFGFRDRAGNFEGDGVRLSHSMFYCLAELNDDGMNFAEIADFIEKNVDRL